ALNRDVLALGGSNRVAARVYANTGTYSGSSNYSRSDMRLTTGNATADTTIEPGGTGLETIHGQNMTETAAFWTGLGFSPPIWNFDNFNRQRFPVLRGL
ncbi:MAG: hypothetical protein FWD13_06260, partial [Treponema sp.]|nr:hypothetical protein [Treponema sp.]